MPIEAPRALHERGLSPPLAAPRPLVASSSNSRNSQLGYDAA
jgi:hypothetical protein